MQKTEGNRCLTWASSMLSAQFQLHSETAPLALHKSGHL